MSDSKCFSHLMSDMYLRQTRAVDPRVDAKREGRRGVALDGYIMSLLLRPLLARLT